MDFIDFVDFTDIMKICFKLSFVYRIVNDMSDIDVKSTKLILYKLH